MPLPAGTRLGAYEVIGLLGQGGMGEVYRATDTKLGRPVAIKVLPEALAFDADRVARFEREARVLASLNHANIASLYGMEEADGRHFLLMELVEGETLAERLKRGALAVERALPIARQIAEALEAAHEKGIVHRDLKPANVKITPDDKVKVLDFGLAKAMAAEDQTAASNAGTLHVTQSPTLSILATQAGIILGTAAYMSPEQAQGLQVDARSDVFSFGTVLYEMLTGRQPFQGDTVAAVLASVLVREVDFSSLPGDLSPRVGELLRRCLEKNPKRRWQAVGDLRAELEIVSTAPRAVPAAAGHAPRSVWRRTLPIALSALLAAAITSIAWWSYRPSPPNTPITRFTIPLPGTGAMSLGLGRAVAISPDGTQVAFVSGGGLYVRSLAELEPKLINSGGGTPVFSPDGGSIAFFSTDQGGTVKRIASTGGPPVTLCRVEQPFYGLSWGPDGIVFSDGGRRVMRVSPDGGKPDLLLSVNDDESAWGPQILPGGTDVLFTLGSDAASAPVWDRARIVVQSLNGGERAILMEGGSDARYLPTGHIVYAVAGVLFARPFDLRELRMTGGPVPIVEGVRRGGGTGTGSLVGIGGASTHFSVSDTGTLVYVPGPLSASTVQRLAIGDRDGGIEPLKLQPGLYQFPRSSPDGKRIVFGTDDGTDAIIWVYELAGTSPMRQLTFQGRNRYPIWSGDGQWIAYQSDREGDLAIFRQRVGGSASAERLTKPDPGASHVPESWSKTDVLAFNITSGSTVSLATVSPADQKVSIVPGIDSAIWPDAVFSPDGKWIAYATRRADQRSATLYVESFPPTGEKHIITGAEHFPAWSPDGRELFFIAPQFKTTPGRVGFASVNVSTSFGFTFGNPAPFDRRFNVTGAAIGRRRTYDVLPPDGRRFIGVIDAETERDSSSTAELHVVTNWFEELRMRVPVK